MEKFTAWMEKHFVPIAAKIGSQKHLVAIRDGFIGIMPITMAGAVATLLNVFFRDLPNNYLPDWHIAETFQWLIGINGNVWWEHWQCWPLHLHFPSVTIWLRPMM